MFAATSAQAHACRHVHVPPVTRYSSAAFLSPHSLTQYELLFCVESSTDPVIALVDSLRQKYPLVDSRLFIGKCMRLMQTYCASRMKWLCALLPGGSHVGVNPKINNMHPGYLAAKYEMIMISDSGIKSKLKKNLVIILYIHFRKDTIEVEFLFCSENGHAARYD